MVALVAIRHVETQGMVVAFHRYPVVVVKPGRQLNTRAEGYRVPEDGILQTERFKGIVSAVHLYHLTGQQIPSLEVARAGDQRCRVKKRKNMQVVRKPVQARHPPVMHTLLSGGNMREIR